jgi:hypothetical protein
MSPAYQADPTGSIIADYGMAGVRIGIGIFKGIQTQFWPFLGSEQDILDSALAARDQTNYFCLQFISR